jgi:hypothetical protein
MYQGPDLFRIVKTNNPADSLGSDSVAREINLLHPGGVRALEQSVPFWTVLDI